MPKGDQRVARAFALRDVVYGEVLWRKGIGPTVRGGARGRGREGGKRGSAGLLRRVVTDDFWRWTSQTSVKDFSLTVASPVQFLEGDGRGECGLEGEGVIGTDALQEGAGQVGEVAGGFGREREGRWRGKSRQVGPAWQAGRWAPPVSGRRKSAG
jgi:hypothetical protein